MHIHTDAMPQPMPEGLAVARLLDHLPGGCVSVGGGRFARLERRDSRRLRCHHDIVDPLCLVVGLAKEDRPPEVIAPALIDAAEVEEDRDRRTELAMPALHTLAKEQG